MQIEVEAVLDGGAVDLGHKAARFAHRRPVDADPVADRDQLVRGLAGMPAAPAADMDAEFARQWRQPALQCTEHTGRDAGAMPVHAHYRPEGLEPERVGETA